MDDISPYTPPKVWTWTTENGGKFANINRPTAGATHEKELPVGEHPLQLYSLATPNGVKVTIMLEELLALGKQAFYAQVELPLAEAYELTSKAIVDNMMMDDAREGIGAFIDKRDPKWTT